MEQVYFISADRLKEDTVINENTDNKLISPTILMVQDIYIQGIIGTSLYNELKTQVKADTVTALNQTLLNDYLQPAIKHYCMAELCLPLTYKFMNKSIVTKNSENSATATPEQLSQIKNYYLNHAEWYAKRIVKYLQQNQSKYPFGLAEIQPLMLFTQELTPITQVCFWEIHVEVLSQPLYLLIKAKTIVANSYE